MAEFRNPDIFIIIGYPGCGKSTLLRKFIELGLKQDKKVLIVRPNDRDWNDYEHIETKDIHKMKGAKTTIFRKGITMPDIVKKFHDGFLIFDDSRH
jgi:ABC-type cobalamin/Fe3+-siderophores transport system ATPase subunit